jgi:FkbM family methyltransferase
VRRALTLAGVLLILGGAYFCYRVGRQVERNDLCCLIPRSRNVVTSVQEVLGLVTFHGRGGQDKWIAETVFPGVTDGFFLDVGSADGTFGSNTKALERKGWAGICIDPFPSNMEDRTCRMLKEVVFSEAGKTMDFQAADDIGGLSDTLDTWKEQADKAPTVKFTTTTLAEILERTKAPSFIHFMSLDIEGAELEALKAFPFAKHRIGAMAVEHNLEEPKRSQIMALMKQHGYARVHTWSADDFYLPEASK